MNGAALAVEFWTYGFKERRNQRPMLQQVVSEVGEKPEKKKVRASGVEVFVRGVGEWREGRLFGRWQIMD